tara:strand:+ start:141 stop:908 length:768 start_codon:yes stop_codon:yes gene_type:complete
MDYEYWAEYLHNAQRQKKAVNPISDIEKDLNILDGYRIQERLIKRRLEEGENLIGVKAGLTSVAKQNAMGVMEPVYGIITDDMVYKNKTTIDLKNFIQPRIEPEIVFKIGQDLSGPNVSIENVLDATESVCCGLEIIDSRYINFKFTLADVVADNTSASAFILGEAVEIQDFKLELLGCLLEIDNEVVETATGAAVLGHPAKAVSLLANWLHTQGKIIKKGWTVLSGGLTNAFPLVSNKIISGSIASLGSVYINT